MASQPVKHLDSHISPAEPLRSLQVYPLTPKPSALKPGALNEKQARLETTRSESRVVLTQDW